MFLKTKTSVPEHVVCAKHLLWSGFLVYNMNTQCVYMTLKKTELLG